MTSPTLPRGRSRPVGRWSASHALEVWLGWKHRLDETDDDDAALCYFYFDNKNIGPVSKAVHEGLAEYAWDSWYRLVGNPGVVTNFPEFWSALVLEAIFGIRDLPEEKNSQIQAHKEVLPESEGPYSRDFPSPLVTQDWFAGFQVDGVLVGVEETSIRGKDLYDCMYIVADFYEVFRLQDSENDKFPLSNFIFNSIEKIMAGALSQEIFRDFTPTILIGPTVSRWIKEIFLIIDDVYGYSDEAKLRIAETPEHEIHDLDFGNDTTVQPELEQDPVDSYRQHAQGGNPHALGDLTWHSLLRGDLETGISDFLACEKFAALRIADRRELESRAQILYLIIRALSGVPLDKSLRYHDHPFARFVDLVLKRLNSTKKIWIKREFLARKLSDADALEIHEFINTLWYQFGVDCEFLGNSKIVKQFVKCAAEVLIKAGYPDLIAEGTVEGPFAFEDGELDLEIERIYEIFALKHNARAFEVSIRFSLIRGEFERGIGWYESTHARIAAKTRYLQNQYDNALSNYAFLLLMTKENQDEAEAILERLGIDENNTEAVFYPVVKHLRQGDTAKALEILNQLSPEVIAKASEIYLEVSHSASGPFADYASEALAALALAKNH